MPCLHSETNDRQTISGDPHGDLTGRSSQLWVTFSDQFENNASDGTYRAIGNTSPVGVEITAGRVIARRERLTPNLRHQLHTYPRLGHLASISNIYQQQVPI